MSDINLLNRYVSQVNMDFSRLWCSLISKGDWSAFLVKYVPLMLRILSFMWLVLLWAFLSTDIFLIILDSTSFLSEKSDSSLSFQCTPEEDRRVNWAKYCDKNKSNSNNNFNSRILGILMPLLSQITMFVTEMIQSFTVNSKGAYLG